MRTRWAEFLADSRGATGVEYAFVAGLVGLVAMGIAPHVSGAMAKQTSAITQAFGVSTTLADTSKEGGGKVRRFVN